VTLFEDNGRETGIQGKQETFQSVSRQVFSWAELRSSVIAFATARF
jgi:hypothetical protein